MPSTYTQEQVKKAKEWLESGDEYDKEHATCILAALEAAQKLNERWDKLVGRGDTPEKTQDDALKFASLCNGWKYRAERAEAYVTALEKAGDGMFGCSAADFDKACAGWHTARKAKP